MRCQDCNKVKPDVTACLEPFYLEITGEEIVRFLCDDCYLESEHNI